MNDRATFTKMEASTAQDWQKIGAEFMQRTLDQARDVPALAAHASALADAMAQLRTATRGAWSTGQPDEALANATPYLQAFGHTVLAWIWLDVALCAQPKLAGASADDAALLNGKLAACTYFFHYELPKIGAWLGVVASRDDTCRAIAEESF